MTDRHKLEGLLAQLNMALAKRPLSAIQIAILRAQIKDLQAKAGK